jgi:oxygen-dependent protoporphyrinogen oxidase
MSPSYCVVGGGISGLVAAYRLRHAAGPDASITVFDPADRLGGALRTERIAGQTVDVGAEAFIARRREVSALLTELGLAGRQVGTTGVRPLIYSGGRLHPMPEGTLQGIPAEPTAVAGLVDDATVAQMLDEPNRPMSWDPSADPSVAEVVGDRFGEQVVARSVDPLLGGVYAGSAATIGLRSAVPTLAAALDRGALNLTDAVREALRGLAPVDGSVFGAVEGGYAVLLDELVAQGRFRWVHAAIARVERTADVWTLIDDEGAHWSADAVVLAVPAPTLPRLIEDVAPRSASAARQIAVASTALVVVALPGGTPLPAQSGVLVATGEDLHAKAVTLTSRKWGRRGNVELVRLSFGRFGDSAQTDVARNVGDERLLAWSGEDLATLFGVNQEPVDCRVQRWIDAMPQYGPGHADVVAEIRAGLPPTIAVAGGYLDGIGVPACVASGTRAAAELVQVVERLGYCAREEQENPWPSSTTTHSTR